jgi:periplasmic divalent cation tolerance protein
MHITIVYIPTPNAAEAGLLVNILLEKKLIACANVVDSNSSYMWDGVLTNENELIIIAKTIPELSGEVMNVVEANHPYDIAAVIMWEAECNKKYYDWVKEMVSLNH